MLKKIYNHQNQHSLERVEFMFRKLATFTTPNLSTLTTVMKEEAPLSAAPLLESTKAVKTQLAKASYQLLAADVQCSTGS